MPSELQLCSLSATGGTRGWRCCSTSMNAAGEASLISCRWYRCSRTALGFCCQPNLKSIQSPLLLLHPSWRKALGIVQWWMERSWGTHMGRPWLCSTLCSEGCWWDGWVSPPGRQPEHLMCPQKAAGCPVCGSIATAAGTFWFLTFTRPGRGFYSNHFSSIARWWIASAPSSFQQAEHFPELIPTGTTSAVAADWATSLYPKNLQEQKRP